MDASQTLEHWFQRADESLPVLTMGTRIAVVVVGVLLWVVGGKLIKAACITGGLLLGVILGALMLMFIDSVGVAIGFMIGLGLVGMLGAWLMFRVWVAMAAAIAMAVVSPAAVLVWQGTPTSEVAADAGDAADQVEQRYNAAADQLSDQTKLQVQQLIDRGDAQSLAEADQLLEEQGAAVLESAREVVFQNLEDIKAWWASKDAQTTRTLGLAMLIGAGVGFLLGFILPNHAAALQSALVGAVLIVVPGRELLVHYVPDAAAWVPTQARGTLITLGLITLVGLALQWTLYLRPDDKQS